MVKALLLIFDPVGTWDKIEKAKRGALAVILQFLLPLLLITSAIEAYGLANLGRQHQFSIHTKPVPQAVLIRYETAQLAFSLLILAGGAWVLKRVGEGFHRRHSYVECFTTIAYSLSPLFLLRMCDAIPAVNSWLCWGGGILLSLAVLYRGIPRIMKPDPSNALGVYVTASFLFVFITGLAHFIAVMILDEKVLAGAWPGVA